MANDVSSLVESHDTRRVATGLGFTEGPVWHPDGYLLFTDIDEPCKILKVVPGEEKELFREDPGRATGLTLDLRGRLIACEQSNRRVTRTEDDGTVASIATHCQGKRLNRPNDVVGRSDGSLYFTNRGATGFEPHERDFDYNGVFRIAPDGEVHEVVPHFENPNGLAFSPDERTFYLANTRQSMHVDAFDVRPDGSLINQRRFYQFHDTGEPGFPDGMKVDVEGRLFCTGPGGVWVIDPDGTAIGVLQFPEQAINMGWGDADNKTLYVAAMTSVYSIRLKTPGVPIPRAS